MSVKFALIKERKSPPDRRVVLTPKKCQKVIKDFPNAKIFVESSDIRAYNDESYLKAGIEVKDDISECDVLLGVKEVPISELIPNKKYFFFSHTIKRQPYNRKLLQAILKNKIELYDHETIVDDRGFRLIGFGRYAGLVGAYNGFRLMGKRDGLFDLPKVETLHDFSEMKKELDKIKLPAIKILLSGNGKVARGAKEILDHLKIKELSIDKYLNNKYKKTVYCMIDCLDYNKRKDGEKTTLNDFFENPKDFESDFKRFAEVSDFYIAGHFYGEDSPYFFTREDAKHPDFKINVVADISCDVNGPIASTIRSSTIADPFYGYDPNTEKEVPYQTPGSIAVMAVDNLPCELPIDSSKGFGRMFINQVMPAFFNNDENGILERAKITTSEGTLATRFTYLQGYVDGEE